MVPGSTDWASLLGRKISVRYFSRAHGQPSEAIGTVMSVSLDDGGHGTMVVLTRRGEKREVQVEDVTAGKVWPLPPRDH